MPSGYRGTIKVARGSLKIRQDCTGLYLSVISPPFQAPSYGMCREDDESGESRLPGGLQSYLRAELSKKQSSLSIYEIGTGKLIVSIPQDLVISDNAWSRDGRYVSTGSTENR
jgi:hypothetical protein